MTERSRKSAGATGSWMTVSRVTRHRRKLAVAGIKRVEVTVPVEDVTLVRELAQTLRAGGDRARKVRESSRLLVGAGKAVSGRDLIGFFRASPLVGEELEFERDKSAGREVDL